MFYNDKLSKKEKRKKTAVILVIVSFLMVWLVLTIRVNIAFPGKTIEKCSYGEWLDYKPNVDSAFNADLSLSPVSCKMYDYNEINEAYSKDELSGDFVTGEGQLFLVFTINVKNNGKEEFNVNMLCVALMYCTEFNGDWNSLELINKGKKTISPEETQSFEFVTSIYVEDALHYNCRERYSEKDVYVIASQYPIERRLVFSIE